MTSLELKEFHDHWVLPLEDQTVVQCRLDYGFVLVLGGPDGYFEIRIGEAFEYSARSGDRASAFNPEGDPAAMGPALAVLRQSVRRARAFKDGRLEIEFSNGGELRVPFGEEFEAWDLVGPGGLRLVSLPGGGDLAIWSANTSFPDTPRPGGP